MKTTHTTTHTPGPWQVMPCPTHAGKHAFHDTRWIATAGIEVERGHDPRSWDVSNGSLICEMRDGPPANARLIAAAPDLLAALTDFEAACADASRRGITRIPLGTLNRLWQQSRAAIAKTKGAEAQ